MSGSEVDDRSASAAARDPRLHEDTAAKEKGTPLELWQQYLESYDAVAETTPSGPLPPPHLAW